MTISTRNETDFPNFINYLLYTGYGKQAGYYTFLKAVGPGYVLRSEM